MATKKLDELEKEKEKAAEEKKSSTVSSYQGEGKNTSDGSAYTRTAAMQKYLQDSVGAAPNESALLKDIRTKLLNRTSFNYDADSDASFKSYLESAKRTGNLAMRDTQGQAAALTGGYGNSYAQTAGQQVYNDYLQEANSRLPEFEELARARYDAETAALGDKYALLKNEHESAIADYQNRYNTAREDWYTEQDRQDAMRDRDIELMLAMGDYDGLDRMGYNTSALRAQRAAEYAQSSDEISAAAAEEEESGGLYSFLRKETVTKDRENDVGDKEYYEHETGNMIFQTPDGKEIKIAAGYNPYTRTKNPDIVHGTFSNGYQPNHIVFKKETTGGKTEDVPVKLTKTGDVYPVKGRNQNIWKTKHNGQEQYWLWDGEANDYVDITEDYIGYIKNNK